MTSNKDKSQQEDIFTYKNVTYIMKGGVLYRVNNQDIKIFETPQYQQINIPPRYQKLTNYQYTEFIEQNAKHLKNKIKKFLEDYYHLTDGGFIYIQQNPAHFLGTALSCMLLNDLYLKGQKSLYYTNLYQITEQTIKNNTDYFALLSHVEVVVIDNIDKIAKAPALYLKNILYNFEWLLYNRFMGKLSTILLSEISFETLINIIGADLYNFINTNLKIKLHLE